MSALVALSFFNRFRTGRYGFLTAEDAENAEGLWFFNRRGRREHRVFKVIIDRFFLSSISLRTSAISAV